MKENRKSADNKKQELKKPPKWFYLVLIAIPVIFFILLELFLRVINYGTDYEYFVSSSEYHTDKLFLNPDLPYKYFYNIEEAPSVLPDGFDKIKKDDAFRVFVLGGSTTAGWPYVPNAAFSRHIKRKLELLYPDNTIEVINCGVSAINTYTINDFTNGILEQKPDLILLYAGHNEYYGALGAGSSVSLGNSRLLVNLYISLIDFKTVQLLQDVVAGIYSFFSSEDDAGEEHETLMSRMIGESLIPLNSDIYDDGISQFNGNLDDIISKIKDENIPLIIGTLTSNLKDQEPFIAIQSDEKTEAGEKYSNALEELNSGNIDEAKWLFILAKDLDGIRFRAPEKFNEIILNKADRYKIPVANIDSVFDFESPDNIVGYNLTVDHLHPNIEGYRLMGETFFREMEENNFLPKGNKINLSTNEIDSVLAKRFPFTELDSIVSEMGIIILTGQYPFVKKNTPNTKMQQRKLNNYVDTIAVSVINKQLKWESAHAHLADYYFEKGDYKNFTREMNAIIEERPYYDVPYKKLIAQLVDKGEIVLALPYLKKLHEIKPSYFTNKWLGQLSLYENNYKKALPFLQKASDYPDADSQLFYNLAGAYYNNGNLKSAIAAAEKSVQLNPQNKLAQQFYYQLKQIK